MLIFFCNVIMVSSLYVHGKRTGWKIRPWPKTVILKIKMIQMKSLVDWCEETRQSFPDPLPLRQMPWSLPTGH